MKKQFYAATVLSAAMALAACDGKDGSNGFDGADGADGVNSLVATRDIAKGDAVCLGGGVALDSGLDTNRNDVLDPAEVTATELLECEATPTLRALHASPDAPAVNIWVNGAPALTGVDYGVGSGFIPVVEENNVQVEAIVPAPGTNLIVIDEDVNPDYNTETTVIAVDDVAGGVDPLVITNASDNRITQGYFRAQVVHAAQGAPGVDVYVTAFGADLDASEPINGVGTAITFPNFTPQLEVPEGDYQIRITLDDDTSSVVYDSGEISLAAGADLMLVAIDNVGPGDSAVQLIVLDGATASTLYDVNTPASVLAAHLSPDAPAVDILADDNGTAAVETIALSRNISFPGVCELASVPAGDYTISIAANADNAVVPLTFPLLVGQGDEAAAFVSGFLMMGVTPEITAIALPGDTRGVFTETKLRITHASPSTPDVDLYLVEQGTDIANVDPTFADVPFGADTTQLSVFPGDYDAYVTAAGSKTPAISLTGQTFSGGQVLDIVARDPFGGEVGPQAEVIDYAALTPCPAP